jgi:hypothetical protein
MGDVHHLVVLRGKTIDLDTDDCIIWPGYVQANGYGKKTARSVPGKSRVVLAHRWVYEQVVGPIPDGLQLDHVQTRGCTNRACVNPRHLEPVTASVNTQRSHPHRRPLVCKHGHDFTAERALLVWVNKSGKEIRRCRLCVNRRQAAYRATHRAHVNAYMQAWREQRRLDPAS